MENFIVILLVIIFLCVFNWLLSKDKKINYTPEIEEKKIPIIQLQDKEEKEMPLEEIPVDINEKQEKESEFMITAYDLYRYLDSALDFYMDSIAIKEDPTELERKQYELIKFWRPSRPDVDVKKILENLVLSNKETDESEKAD